MQQKRKINSHEFIINKENKIWLNKKIRKWISKKAQFAFSYLESEFQKINSCRVNPNTFNQLKVLAYEQWILLIQLANVSAMDARSLIINPYDSNLIKVIAKALTESEYKVNHQIYPDCINVIFAPLTK